MSWLITLLREVPGRSQRGKPSRQNGRDRPRPACRRAVVVLPAIGNPHAVPRPDERHHSQRAVRRQGDRQMAFHGVNGRATKPLLSLWAHFERRKSAV